MVESAIATRPQRASQALGVPVKVFSNYFNLKFKSPDIKGIQKYHLKFTPEIPDNSLQLKKTLLRKVRDQVKEKLAFYIFWGNCIFSYKAVDPLTLNAEEEGVNYAIEITWVQTMEATDKDHMGFLKIFFNSMMRSLRFETIGPKSFNPKNAKKLPAHNIAVWPGFDARLIMKEQGVLLNIDVAFKVLRNDSALGYLNKLKEDAERRGGDWQKSVQDTVAGMTVVTRYNQRTYRVERVEFEQNPESTFQKGEETVTFKDYFHKQYQETISDLQQPLLVHKDRKTGRESYLIPELCQLTGLTDAMRADFRLMKDLAQITHTDAQRKVSECRNLFEVFRTNEKCKKKMEEWQLEFKEEPACLEGYKFSPGNLIMGTKDNGQRNIFDIERTGREIDRKIQDRMYTQPDLNMWAIFYSDRDQQVAKQFSQTMGQCLTQFGYKGSPPAMFPVANGNRADSW
jgi:aubergine-like protein